MLHEDEEERQLHLLVLTYYIYSLVVVGHLFGHHLGGIGRCLDGREQFLDFLFRAVDVDVANDDDALVLRIVPFAVVVAERFGVTAVDNLHQSDGEALAVFASRIELGQHGLDDFLLSHDAHAILIVHDVTLLVDGFRRQRQSVRPVFQHEQTRVECRDACRRHVGDEIYRLVDASRCIQVATVFHTDGLQILLQGVALEVVRAVEGHVLQEVGQSALVVVLVDGAHFLGDVEVDHMFGIVVFADVISQSVVQFADANLRVNRKLGHFLCERSCSVGQQQQAGGQESQNLFHCH